MSQHIKHKLMELILQLISSKNYILYEQAYTKDKQLLILCIAMLQELHG